MNSKYKIILVDDHKMFREGLRFLLSRTKTIEIIGEADNGRQLINMLETMTPDVVLMDINMPEMDGIEATSIIHEQFPGIKIIALSMNGDEVYYYKMIQAGANGFVLKKAGSEELEEAIVSVMNGQDYFSAELMKNIIMNLGTGKKENTQKLSIFDAFTPRETEVLHLICNGFSSKEIGDKLFISARTVEGHKARVMEKMGAKNTSSLIILAIKNKLIDI
ncbi:MAG: response regulator transcription factor [Bacteroidota bacterium]